MAIDMTPDLINSLVQSDPSLKRLITDRAVNMARQQVLSQLTTAPNVPVVNAMSAINAITPQNMNDQLVNWAVPAAQQAAVPQPQAAAVQAAVAQQAQVAPQSPLAIVDAIYKEVQGNFEALHQKVGALAEGVEKDFKEIKETLAKFSAVAPAPVAAPTLITPTPAAAPTTKKKGEE